MKKGSELNDEELIELVNSGRSDAFAGLVDRYQSLVAATVMNMVKDRQVADEIGQDTFVKLYKSLDQFEGKSKLSTYITRIAMNASLNYLKRQQWKSRLFMTTDSLKSQTSASHGSTMESKDLVEKALNTLSEEARSVVVVRKIQGFSTKETAKILEISEGTVMSRLKRAMDQLKNTLNK